MRKRSTETVPGVRWPTGVHHCVKAVAFGEALRDEFKEYQQQVLKNAKASRVSCRSKSVTGFWYH